MTELFNFYENQCPGCGMLIEICECIVQKTHGELNTDRTIKTFTGHYIDVFDPAPNHISIDDIAHALSHTPRWGGHTEAFYSVASHSMWVADKVPDGYKMEALLHDATEAYIGDMPKPIKRHLPDFRKLESLLDNAIREKFGLPMTISKVVKDADKIALEFEWLHIKNGEWQSENNHLRIRDNFLDHFYAFQEFNT